MDRVINNEYKMADSRIIYNQRKKRFFLLLTYKFEPPKVTTNPDRIMGVDLGLAIPATVTINEDRKSTRLNSSHVSSSYAVYCLKKKIKDECSRLLEASTMKSRRGFAIQRLMNAMRQAHADCFFIVFHPPTFTLFPYTTLFRSPPKVTTNPDRIMGVDLGLAIPATVTIN